MFVSTEFLGIRYGVDNAIAKFFVDREPPKNNYYWKDKLLYLRPAPGYLFIPLIVDLLSKIGIDKQQLLSEDFISPMEQVGHISALEEIKKISSREAVNHCNQLIGDNCNSNQWKQHLSEYFQDKKENLFSRLATPYRALRRGDMFLFSICRLQFDDKVIPKIAELWFALISSLLLQDDADDLEEDLKTGDENAFIESGLNAGGLAKIEELFKKNIKTIAVVNRTMANQLEEGYKTIMQLPQISQLKNK